MLIRNGVGAVGVLLSLALTASAGCYRDRHGTDTAGIDDAGNAPLSHDYAPAHHRTGPPATPAVALGMPIYPGATIALGPDGAPIRTTTDGVVSEVIETTDALDKVAAYYAQQMHGANRKDQTTGRLPAILLSEPAEATGLKTAQIRPDGDVTQVELMHILPSKAGEPTFRPKGL